MAMKRKRDEPAAIEYGSSTPWLQCLGDVPACQTADDDLVADFRDPALADLTNEDVVWGACKVAYLLFHNLDMKDQIIRSIGVACDTYEANSWIKKMQKTQGQWKSAILNKFLFPHVHELVRKWHVAHAWRTFGALTEEERFRVWLEEYDADPKRTITSMYKPVIGVLDTSHVFSLDVASADDKAKMKAVRVMLRNKYMLGCEITYKYRIMTDEKDICSSKWTSYSETQSSKDTIVAIADLPIVSELMSSRKASRAKRVKNSEDSLQSK